MDDPLICVRALHFAATLTVAGVAFFIVLVAEPASRKADVEAALRGVIRRRLAWLAWISLSLTVLSGAAWLVLLARSISDQPLAAVFSQGILWIVLSQTEFGRAWLGRLVLAGLLAAFFVPFLSPKTARSVWISLAVVVVAAALVGTLAWAGHAVGGSGMAGLVHPAADILHLVAAAAWVGALLPLVLVSAPAGRTAPVAMARAVALRFSALGIVCVTTLFITGMINTWYLAGGIAGLTETDYGHLLLLKIALFFAMVAIAAVNRLRFTPRLVAANGRRQDALRRLRRNVAIEIAAGAGILAIVAVLGVTPPGVDERIMPQAHHHSH